MFCYQCQEAAGNKGCRAAGVCGKNDAVATLQDLLIYLAKGIAYWRVKTGSETSIDKEADLFIIEALFTTITNVSFSEERIAGQIGRALKIREQVKNEFLKSSQVDESILPDAAVWTGRGIDAFLEKGALVGVLSTENEDIRSLRELLIYGVKGAAAYTDHAAVLGYTDQEIFDFINFALAATLDDSLNIDDLVTLVLKAGKVSVDAMALLDKANTERFGNPEITSVEIGTKEGPGILVSGHDLLDLEELLKQTEGTGINIYTHGEMLPANAYPALKKYKHLAGNYGTSWYNQQSEFEKFSGAILMTTNCLQKPRESYQDRIYTTGLVSWPDVKHIADREKGKEKDFSGLIAAAKQASGLKEEKVKTIPIGFAHQSTLQVADKIVEAVKSGAIKKFVVMAGCDGRHKERSYFTEVAKALPQDAVILTAGCAKYRYNMLDLGDIGGIPRVIDAGQCNDSYSLVMIALKLAEVFGVESVNDLPIAYDIAWYEQKAVCVLLALLYLGVTNIQLGPTVPAFLSSNVLNVLVDKFGIKPITTVENDIAAIMS